MSTNRNQSIECLRFFLMTLIVFGHILFFGIKNKVDYDGNPTMFGYLQPLYLFHVDAFIFISGYFGIKHNWEKLIVLVIKMVIYSMISATIVGVFFDSSILSFSGIFANLYPISACDWWFMSQYLYLLLLAPLLNPGIDKLSKCQLLALVVVLYISSFRLYYCLLIFIYILGRYFSRYPCEFLERNSGKIFMITVLLYSFCNLFFLTANYFPDRVYNNMSPFNVLAAVAIFFFFKKLNITWKGCGFIGSGVLAAYLITTHEIMQLPFNRWIVDNIYNSCVLWLFMSGLIVVVCSLIDRSVTAIISLFAKKFVAQK